MNPEFSRFTAVISKLNARFSGEALPQGKRAELLGVTREHLNRVLNGKRESRSLLRRHLELIGGTR